MATPVGRFSLGKRIPTEYISGVISELRKVRWPSRQETLRLSILVVIVYIVLGLFLGFVDLGFARLAEIIGA